jgi:hypothetical protein
MAKLSTFAWGGVYPQLDNANMRTPSNAPSPLLADLYVLVPWATCLSPACEATWPALDKLPNTALVLQQLSHISWLQSDEYAPNPPHEVLWAQTLGWPTDHELTLPWGALLAQETGLVGKDMPHSAWGLITPCHWAMGHDSLTVLPIDDASLDAAALSNADSRALFDAALPLFESEGWQLYWVSALQWLACHPSLADMPTASLDRVLGRNPDVWMPSQAQTRLIRRLQAEVQMLWYHHPVNAQREQQGERTVNSFWLSGCGRTPVHTRASPELLVADGPRQALLRMDTPAWRAAWENLDNTVMPQCLSAISEGQTVQLSLCGERHAVTCQTPAPSPWWQRALRPWSPKTPSLSALLQAL